MSRQEKLARSKEFKEVRSAVFFAANGNFLRGTHALSRITKQLTQTCKVLFFILNCGEYIFLFLILKSFYEDLQTIDMC